MSDYHTRTPVAEEGGGRPARGAGVCPLNRFRVDGYGGPGSVSIALGVFVRRGCCRPFCVVPQLLLNRRCAFQELPMCEANVAVGLQVVGIGTGLGGARG